MRYKGRVVNMKVAGFDGGRENEKVIGGKMDEGEETFKGSRTQCLTRV